MIFYLQMGELVRVTLELPANEFDALNESAEQRGITFPQALRESLALDRLRRGVESEGGSVLIANPRHRSLREWFKCIPGRVAAFFGETDGHFHKIVTR